MKKAALMRKYGFRLGMPAALALALAMTAFGARAAESTSSEQAQKVAKANDVIQQMMDIPEQGVPPRLLAKAQGIAIIPDAIKVGFVIAGQRGHGLLFVRGEDGRWRNPAFITLTSGSIGWQIGAQATDFVLVFKHRSSVEGIAQGKFTLGADASVAAGPVGRNASAATDIKLRSEVYSYSRTRGLFAGIALKGAALQIDYTAIQDYYGKPLTAQEVFSMPLNAAPAGVTQLRELLAHMAPPERVRATATN